MELRGDVLDRLEPCSCIVSTGSSLQAALPPQPSALGVNPVAPLQVPTCSLGRPGANIIRHHGPAAHIVAFHVGHQEVMPLSERKRQTTVKLADKKTLCHSKLLCFSTRLSAWDKQTAATPGLPNPKSTSPRAGTASLGCTACQNQETHSLTSESGYSTHC